MAYFCSAINASKCGEQWPIITPPFTPFLEEALSNMPTSTKKQRAQRKYVEWVLEGIKLSPRMYYTDAPRSPRIFAAGFEGGVEGGLAVNHLPRELRKIALAGEFECDLRSCQLAVAAMLWNLADLQKFLGSGQSFWNELLGFLELGSDRKPIIKCSVYALLYGMSKENLTRRLASGFDSDDPEEELGIGDKKVIRFFSHPLIESLWQARKSQMELIMSNRGAHDVFGRWIRLDTRKGIYAPSVMSSVIQSYELKLMLSVLPVIEYDPQIYLLSWLHDGITVHLGNTTKQEIQIKKLKQAVLDEATSLGIATELEVKKLPQNR